MKNKNLTGDCARTSELAQEFLHITAYLANFEPVMKLSGDQKRLVKFFAVYIPCSAVIYPILRWLLKGSFSWEETLLTVLAMVLGGMLVAVLYVAGSSVPKKDGHK